MGGAHPTKRETTSPKDDRTTTEPVSLQVDRDVVRAGFDGDLEAGFGGVFEFGGDVRGHFDRSSWKVVVHGVGVFARHGDGVVADDRAVVRVRRL